MRTKSTTRPTTGLNTSAVRVCKSFITVNGQESIEALFSMTPYYWKTDVEGGERLRALDVLETEIKFDFLVYRKK